MKKEMLVIVVILVLAVISTVVSITLNTIEPGTLESGNITFSSAGSDTSYHFNLSKNATVFSASMNVTGYPYDTGYGLQYPTNPSIDVGNDGDSDWNYTGVYNFTNRTLDFSSEIQDFLDSCTADVNGYCNVTVNVSSESAGIIGLNTIHISYDFVTKKNYTIVEDKTNYTVRWYNASLADVIDDMEPAQLDNLSQTKYDELKNITLYQKIVFFNNFTIDPEVTSPLNYNINDTNNSRFVIKLNKTLDDNTYAFLKIYNMTLYSRSGNSYFVKLNPLEITNLSNTSYLRGIWEIPIDGKLGDNLTEVNVTENYNVTIWLFDDVNCSTAEPILSPYITESFKGNHSFNETCSEQSHYVAAEINGSNINKTANESIVEKILLNTRGNVTNYNAQLATVLIFLFILIRVLE